HGVMMRPYLDASESSQEIGRVVSTQASEEAVKMMTIDVLHGAIAKISGYNVAGKSGSAQVPNLKTGGYTNQLIDSYVGFAPAYNPRFVILVKLNEPAGAPLSGVVVPTFHDLAQYILNYYNVPPDNVSQ
ncbi:MAG TPA: penicillin-binding transpeptidase domain-containing protein, partial [Candidatus Tyrphobacter sp.]|nr:penicillin-binding transpeptidase domain-containing protein [Candidatus Tyrphobacter sp.]